MPDATPSLSDGAGCELRRSLVPESMVVNHEDTATHLFHVGMCTPERWSLLLRLLHLGCSRDSLSQQNAIRVTPHGSRGWAFRGFALLLSFFLLECRPGTPCKAADLAQGRLGGLGRRTEAPWPAACPNGQTRCQSEAISDLQPRQPTS